MYNGEKIAELLREKGLKKKDLMNALGWHSTNQVQQVIDGNPRADTLEAICNFLEVPLDTLFIRNTYTNNTDIEKIQCRVIEQQKQTIDSLHELLNAEKQKNR